MVVVAMAMLAFVALRAAAVRVLVPFVSVTVHVTFVLVFVHLPLFAVLPLRPPVTVYDFAPLTGFQVAVAFLPLIFQATFSDAYGYAEALDPDALLVPTAFVATTVKVYLVPFVSEVTLHDVVALVHVLPPGDAVTV